MTRIFLRNPIPRSGMCGGHPIVRHPGRPDRETAQDCPDRRRPDRRANRSVRLNVGSGNGRRGDAGWGYGFDIEHGVVVIAVQRVKKCGRPARHKPDGKA